MVLTDVKGHMSVIPRVRERQMKNVDNNNQMHASWSKKQ